MFQELDQPRFPIRRSATTHPAPADQIQPSQRSRARELLCSHGEPPSSGLRAGGLQPVRHLAVDRAEILIERISFRVHFRLCAYVPEGLRPAVLEDPGVVALYPAQARSNEQNPSPAPPRLPHGLGPVGLSSGVGPGAEHPNPHPPAIDSIGRPLAINHDAARRLWRILASSPRSSPLMSQITAWRAARQLGIPCRRSLSSNLRGGSPSSNFPSIISA